MDAVDSSDRYDVSAAEDTPSLLTVVLDTNPRAWASLAPVLPLSRAIANVLVLVNAHLSFSNVNQVALIAAHNSRAAWLYPEHQQPSSSSSSSSSSSAPPPATAAAASTTTAGAANPATNTDHAGDTEMAEAPPGGNGGAQKASANKYPQFAQIEAIVLRSIKRLIEETTSQDLACETTKLSGALTLALSHINKVSQSLTSSSASSTAATLPGSTTSATEAAAAAAQAQASAFRARILVLSVSDPEPSQYIPTMNAVFAAARAAVAVDTLSLCGADSAFLQQAAFSTGGSFVPARDPRGLLSYLMFALVPDAEARASLVMPASDVVDFRAACFCHGDVVDTGFVCSVCLSIFCELPAAEADAPVKCLTCGTALSLGNYGAKPAVVPRKKKKKKRVINGVTREETGSATATPMR